MVVADDLGLKAGEARQFGDDGLAFAGGQRRALLEGGGILGPDKFVRLGEGLGQIGLQIGRQFLVEMRRRRVGRQKAGRAGRCPARRPDGAEIQDAGDENQPVQIHAVARAQMLRQPRRAENAVAFAAKIFRREPALVPRGPEPDEFTHGVQVGDRQKTRRAFRP